MNERFQFLRTYADSLIELEKADKDLARELAWKIIQYWIYNKNEDSWNPIIEAMFVQIKLMIDKGQSISKANSENWKRWWRPSKNWENSQKANWKRTENETKTNEKQIESESKTKKSKIENRKDKIENNINNKLTLISEDKSSQESYWNEEVNRCLSLIKTFNHWILNWSDSLNRRHAWNLINKLKKFDSVVKWEYLRDEVLEWILTVISQNDFYRWKIGSPKLIYDNLWTLVQVCWKESKNLQGTTTLQVI